MKAGMDIGEVATQVKYAKETTGRDREEKQMSTPAMHLSILKMFSCAVGRQSLDKQQPSRQRAERSCPCWGFWQQQVEPYR